MSIFDKVFTDAVKDVIGNDPVLDQFDISYAASFYGTMSDNYITGSILASSKVDGALKFTTGSRGRAFRKFEAGNQPPLSSLYSSPDVATIPELSYRQVPWSDRVSKSANRTVQLFDSNERYYDSCLPDLKECLTTNGSRPWKLNSKTALSPFGNVDTSRNCFLFFNTVPLSSSRQSQGYDNDPTINNEWTWSYPYEGKYNPTNRFTKTTESLGINKSDLSVDWNIEFESALLDNWNIKIENLSELDVDKPFLINGIIPILPGRLGAEITQPIGARNSLRGVFEQDIPYNTKAVYAIDSQLDSKTGVSFLVPADVNLGRYADHSFLGALSPSVSDPGNELLTGSMTTDDSVKFFFGFGDLNNMTYSKYIFSSNEEDYVEDFEQGGLVRYYFSGSVGTAQPTKRESDDRRLIRTLPDTTNTFTRTSSEAGPSGAWIPVTALGTSNDIAWLTDNSDPSTTTIPAGTWSFFLNCQGNQSKIKAKIYSWNGTTSTLLGETEEKNLSVSMTFLQLDWTIASNITINSSDRILVEILVYLFINSTACYATFKNKHAYLPLNLLTRYSNIVTNVPITYNPGVFYTQAKNLDSYNQDGLVVNWSNSPTAKSWMTIYKSGSSGDYNYWGPGPLSGTITPYMRGLFGPVSSNNDFILYSSGSYDASQQEFSICCMDITSSLPWSLKYDRAVAGREDFFFTSYISGYPGKPSGLLSGGPFEPIEVLEVVTGSNNDPGTSAPTKKYYHDYFATYDSSIQTGGTSTTPYTFPPGEWRINFKLDWNQITSSPANEFVMVGLDNVTITTYSVSGDPYGPKIGGNNYPTFRTYRVDPRANETINEGTSINKLATKSLHEANVFGVSPVIRGWKYGLYSGLPMNSKVVFRRDKFGQFRDMLEQRQYTKFINVEDSVVEDDATTKSQFNRLTSSRLSKSIRVNSVGTSVVDVKFFKQRYKKDDRGIGYIYNESVSPELTVSQNLSPEVTSSLPYFDGESKTRQESSYALIKDATLTSVQLDVSGLTVT